MTFADWRPAVFTMIAGLIMAAFLKANKEDKHR
jgi:hypothetical protein